MIPQDALAQDEDRVGPRIQRRLFLALAGVTLFFVTMIVVMLPYRLYERDV